MSSAASTRTRNPPRTRAWSSAITTLIMRLPSPERSPGSRSLMCRSAWTESPAHTARPRATPPKRAARSRMPISPWPLPWRPRARSLGVEDRGPSSITSIPTSVGPVADVQSGGGRARRDGRHWSGLPARSGTPTGRLPEPALEVPLDLHVEGYPRGGHVGISRPRSSRPGAGASSAW